LTIAERHLLPQSGISLRSTCLSAATQPEAAKPRQSLNLGSIYLSDNNNGVKCTDTNKHYKQLKIKVKNMNNPQLKLPAGMGLGLILTNGANPSIKTFL